MTDVSVEKPKRRQPKTDYLPMDDAPQDGKVIILTDGADQEIEGIWRHSRQFDKRLGKWTQVGFWAIGSSGGQPIAWLPVGWRAKMGV